MAIGAMMVAKRGTYFKFNGMIYRVKSTYLTKPNRVKLALAIGADGEEFGFHPSFIERPTSSNVKPSNRMEWLEAQGEQLVNNLSA